MCSEGRVAARQTARSLRQGSFDGQPRFARRVEDCARADIQPLTRSVVVYILPCLNLTRRVLGGPNECAVELIVEAYRVRRRWQITQVYRTRQFGSQRSGVQWCGGDSAGVFSFGFMPRHEYPSASAAWRSVFIGGTGEPWHVSHFPS